jgi:hypothetical protein
MCAFKVALRTTFALVWILIGAIRVMGDDTNNTLTVNGRTYSNVVFLSFSPYAVQIRHSSGISSVPLASLSPELQKRFGYSAEKAEQYRMSEAELARQQAAVDQQRAAIRAAQKAKDEEQLTTKAAHEDSCTKAIIISGVDSEHL